MAAKKAEPFVAELRARPLIEVRSHHEPRSGAVGGSSATRDGIARNDARACPGESNSPCAAHGATRCVISPVDGVAQGDRPAVAPYFRNVSRGHSPIATHIPSGNEEERALGEAPASSRPDDHMNRKVFWILHGVARVVTCVGHLEAV